MVQPMRVCCPTPSEPVQPLKALRTQCVAQCAEPGTCLTSTMSVCYVFCLKSSRRSVLELQSFDSKLPASYKSNHTLLQNHLVSSHAILTASIGSPTPASEKSLKRGIPKVDKYLGSQRRSFREYGIFRHPGSSLNCEMSQGPYQNGQQIQGPLCHFDRSSSKTVAALLSIVRRGLLK